MGRGSVDIVGDQGQSTPLPYHGRGRIVMQWVMLGGGVGWRNVMKMQLINVLSFVSLIVVMVVLQVGVVLVLRIDVLLRMVVEVVKNSHFVLVDVVVVVVLPQMAYVQLQVM